jgi:DNA recombination protein RmuC
MTDVILLIVLVVGIANIALLALMLSRASAGRASEVNVREELRQSREEAGREARASREELTGRLDSANAMLAENLRAQSELQRAQLEGVAAQLKALGDSNEQKLDQLRTTLDGRVKAMQESNEQRLDQMRQTVDEKLHATLEKRLGESFKLVSAQLEAVQRGLGEMQQLATGVGDLKRVLSNVKTRGTWGEIQLGSLLEQVLAPSQYDKNVKVKPDSNELVEFAIRMPGSPDDQRECVWLPIDSKFPQEDYLRLLEAAEKGDAESTQQASAALGRAVVKSAQDIRDKYICQPYTTDVAIMFLPTEGLYAEVLRQPALVEEILNKYRVVIAGPASLGAILSSFRMGFQALAIQQQSDAVWQVLGAVKTEFRKFGEVLDKVKKQLNTAANTIEQTGVRSRAIERKLREVESLPESEATDLLGLPEFGSKRGDVLADEPEPFDLDEALE